MTTSPRPRDAAARPAALLAWLAAVGGAVVALVLFGRGMLAGPPIAEPAQWSTWLSGRDPAVATVALVRLVALAFAVYLAAVTLLAVLARAAGAAGAAAVLVRLVPTFARQALAGALGLGLATSLTASPAAFAGPTGPPLTPPHTAVLRVVDTPPALPAPPHPPPAPAAAQTWTVEPGDHFWSVARNLLAGHWAREPADAEVAGYWRVLIDTNRARLANPADPNLLFAGQSLVVPPLPSDPRAR